MDQHVMPNSAYRPSYTGNANYIPTHPYTDQVVGMAYVPWQHWRNIYTPCKGFVCGTIFQDLDKPFEGVHIK